MVAGKPKHFLDVEISLSGKRWVARLDERGRNLALQMAETSGLSELITRVLAARGVSGEPERFLDPTIRDLMPDPSTLTDMDAAVQRLVMAIDAKQRVAIFGDYDVDGACASALVSRFLSALDVENEIYIPDRIFEGYGPNTKAIDDLIARGAELIVTVDCGATSFEALQHAQSMGVDVVVLDHHQMGTQVPHAAAVVNPNRQDDLSGLGYLCAAGVVFMTLVAVQRSLRESGKPIGINLMANLDLVALATVCDVVPLIGLNRAFVVKGLIAMQTGSNAGLVALRKAARLEDALTPYHLGFMLGPRINAGGRIGDAALGSRLLTLENASSAETIAAELDTLNAARQEVERVMLDEALEEAQAEIIDAVTPPILITERQGWHPGIVGLIAARLKERFSRPAIAIAFDPSGKGSGSARSIPGVDIGAMVRAAVEAGILAKGGGHAMAAGLTVQRESLGAFRAFVEEKAANTVEAARAADALKIDGALSARGASLELFDLLERAGPYGAGHPQPVFAFPDHTVTHARVVGRDHVSFQLRSTDGATLRAILFRKAESDLGRALLDGQGQRFHLAGTLSADFWQGKRRMQLRLNDAAHAD